MVSLVLQALFYWLLFLAHFLTIDLKGHQPTPLHECRVTLCKAFWSALPVVKNWGTLRETPRWFAREIQWVFRGKEMNPENEWTSEKGEERTISKDDRKESVQEKSWQRKKWGQKPVIYALDLYTTYTLAANSTYQAHLGYHLTILGRGVIFILI